MTRKQRSSADTPEKGFARYLVPIVILSAALNLFLLLQARPAKPGADDERAKHPYLASRVFVANPNTSIINFVPLRREVTNYAQQLENKVGIFFQYLPTGISVAYNADEPFISSSLLKVPTVMKTYKLIEEGKVRKTDSLYISPETRDSSYGELWRRGLGGVVTVDEAIRESLITSDNTAHRLLYNLSQGRPSDIYSYLDVPLETVAGEVAITPRNYTSIFRSLYYSAYLSVPSSNEVLGLLTESTDGDVLRATIPLEIAIAQKSGVAYLDSDRNKIEFRSYCGLFYVPRRPYTLCVMGIADQQTVIQQARDISEIVYEFVSAH